MGVAGSYEFTSFHLAILFAKEDNQFGADSARLCFKVLVFVVVSFFAAFQR